MTLTQQIITIALCVLGTQLTRFVPFLIFNEHRKTPAFVQYLGKVLPGAIFSMLVVYCMRSVSFRRYSYGLPELIGIFITAGLHLWKRNILLSIAAGTITYMLLIRYVFVEGSPGRGSFSAAAGVIFLLYKVSAGSPLENYPQLCYDYCA